MKTLIWLFTFLFLTFATPAFGQATRTWVSGVGDDANPCSRTAPCKTFAGAISKTAAGGEINVLDSGGFGAITINKSITIDGAGAHGSILAVNTNGVIVNGAGITVNLRNLSINGAGGTIGNGIRIIAAGAVNVDNVNIMNFAGTGANGRGIAIETSAGIRVTVSHVSIYNMGNHGIHSNPGAANVVLAVADTSIQFLGTGSAIDLRTGTTAAIDRANLSQNRNGAGVTLETSTVTARISNSLVAFNALGVVNAVGSGTAAAFINGNTITGNTTAGLQINSGTITSIGNNLILGNTTNGAPSSTVPGQ